MGDVFLNDAFFWYPFFRLLLVLRGRVELSGLVVWVWFHVNDRVSDLEGEQLLIDVQRSAS